MQRLHYFDLLKGMAIFMVVMGHVVALCVREIDRCTMFKLIGQVHMPLFFFISGWFSFKALPTGKIKIPSVPQRALQLLLPMVVVSTVWIYYFPYSGLQSPFNSTFNGLWSDLYKNGYWFTLVLFQIMVIYAVTVPVFEKIKSMVLQIIFIAVATAVLYAIQITMPDKAAMYSSFSLVVTYFPVFCFGVVAARNRDWFFAMTENNAIVTISILACAFTVYILGWYWEFPDFIQNNIRLVIIIFHVCLAIVAIAIARPYCERVFSGQSTNLNLANARFWQYLGKNSLTIYLLHYFFLFPLGNIRDFLTGINLGFAPMVFITAAVALSVIAMVLLVNIVISKSPLLSMILTGARLPRKKNIEQTAIISQK